MKEIIISSIKGLGKSGHPQKKKKNETESLLHIYTPKKKN